MHTRRKASPGLDASRMAGSFPNLPSELSHAISVKSTKEFSTHF